jgi:hypothetical protein
MTGNNFRPDIVARIIELIRTGETDLTPTCTAAKPMIPRQQHGLPAMACVSAM